VCYTVGCDYNPTLNPKRGIFSCALLSFVISSQLTTDVQRGQGGSASRCSGGKDEPPRPTTSCSINSVGQKPSHAIRRWVPPSSIRRDAQTPEEKHNVTFRRVRGILNKITPEKFRKLSEEILCVGLDSTYILRGVILLIFEKALEEPKYSSMYAQLCRKLSDDAPNFEPQSNSSGPFANTFCRLLLAKCKDEFDNRRKAAEAFDSKDGPLTADEEEQRSIAKHKMLGNIKFICELGKQHLLQMQILHLCIKQLLSKNKRDEHVQEKAEDLECLCQIMKTVGRLLDTEQAKSLMDQYFDRMEHYSRNMGLNSRIRFMLQDVLELRNNKWQPRRVQREHGPRTIIQIREEAAKDYGVYFPPHQYAFGPLRGPQLGPGVPMKPNLRPFDDFLNPSFPQFGSTLGTGPGVIAPDTALFPVPQRRGIPITPHNQPQQNNHLAYNHQLVSQQKRDNGRQQPNMPKAPSPPIIPAAQAGAGGRELPPRFLKKVMQQQQQQQQMQQPPASAPVVAPVPAPIQLMPQNPLASLANHTLEGGISLRPAQNSMMLKPNIPQPKSAQQSAMNIYSNTNMGKPPMDAPLLIKTNKSNKNESINSNDAAINTKNMAQQSNKNIILEKMEDALNDFVSENQNIDDVIQKFKDLNIPKDIELDALVTIMRKSLEKSESDREVASKLLAQLKNESVIGPSVFLNAFKTLLNQMPELEVDIPRVKSHVAGFVARAITDDVITFKEAAEPLDEGQHYPLFLLCLQHLHKTKGQVWLNETFTDSKINLMNALPEIDRNKERLADILEDRGLSFLYPLLRIESDLWKQMTQPDCTPSSLYRWLKDNVDPSLHSTPGFIGVLFTCFFKHITNESSKQIVNENEAQQQTTNSSANITDFEKEMMSKYQAVFRAFLQDRPNLQLVVLYSLQSHCFHLGFPKGMVLRFFILLYDLEIIEEEAFLKWKEDINDEYPGKGKALFQVNQWLCWLEEAEEEEEDDDGSDSGTK